MFSGLASQHAIKLILVSEEVDLRVDSNDSSPMCISCKTKKLFLFNMNRVYSTMATCVTEDLDLEEKVP